MRINGVELEYQIDYVGRTFHIKDKGRYHNLFNVISPEFQMNVIEGENLLLDIIDFDWICYGSNSLVMEFKEYGLVFVSKTDNRLYKPFMSV
jgi:hypothetical protein